jgi:hypothetical protein
MSGFGIVHDQKQVFVHTDELKKAKKIMSALEIAK